MVTFRTNYLKEIEGYLGAPSEKIVTRKSKYQQDIKWPEDFFWDENNKCLVVGPEKMVFNKKDGIRTKLIKRLAEAKDYVQVSLLSKIVSRSPNEVRINLAQLRERIRGNEKLRDYIDIDSSGSYERGSYRLVPYPKKNLIHR